MEGIRKITSDRLMKIIEMRKPKWEIITDFGKDMETIHFYKAYKCGKISMKYLGVRQIVA